MTGCATHLIGALSPIEREQKVEKALAILRHWMPLHPFDVIAVRGVSGMTFGSILAHHLGLPLTVVRKSEDKVDCHSPNKVEHGREYPYRFLFVDDLIASGDTYQKVASALGGVGCKAVAYLLYSGESIDYTLLEDPLVTISQAT